MKLTFLFVFVLFTIAISGQTIEGKYCWTYKFNKFMGHATRCFEFDGKGRFISTLITDIGIVEEGDYQIEDNLLTMIFDLADNMKYIREDYEEQKIKEFEGWSFEKYYEEFTGLKIGERLTVKYAILKNTKEKLKLKNLSTKKRFKLYRNSEAE